MIIRVVTGVAGTIPEKTFSFVRRGEVYGSTRAHNLDSYTYFNTGTLSGGQVVGESSEAWARKDENGVTASTNWQATFSTQSVFAIGGGQLSTKTGLKTTSSAGYYSNSAYTYTAAEFVSYSTTSRPLEAAEGAVSFSTTTVTIPSAKVVSVGTYTFLSQTTGSTTTSRFLLTNFTQKTTGSTTADGSAVYITVTRGGAALQTYASTRWEVFDNSDGNSIFSVVAGQGGLPSYQELQAGLVLGEAGYDVEVGQIVVATYRQVGTGRTASYEAIGTIDVTSRLTTSGTRTWTEFLTYETSYEATEEVWEPYQTTREGWTETTLATTTELFGTETDTTVDTGTTYVETYEDYSSTTKIADYQIYDTLTETSLGEIYRFTKTANRELIGTKPDISSYGETETFYKTKTSSESWSAEIGNRIIQTGTEAYVVTSNFSITKPKSDGALVGCVYATTKHTTIERNSTTTYEARYFSTPEVSAVYQNELLTEQLQGNFISSFQTSSGINPNASPLIAGAAIENFLLEPVGPPAIGGVHRSGRALELVDNCPHTFPAILLWQGVHETIHAAAFASSFYEGGVPLISHNTPWEHESRTYNWITADGARGTLKVQGAVNSTSQSSTTFTIGVDGQCDYTGAKQTSQAGGEYFSSRKATLVANCPAVVSIEGGTKTFGVGTHEITEPMRFDIRQAGSVIAPGIVVIGPTYSPYQNVYLA